jgi:glycosyltransferase involved in cell wall biosynthesis
VSELKSKIKVCFVTQEIPPIFVNGGAGTATLGYAEELSRDSEFEVTVLYTSFSYLGIAEKRKVVREFKSKEIELEFLEDMGPVSLWNNTAPSKSFSIMLYLSNRNFEVVHFNDFDGLAFYSTCAKRSGLSLNKTHINVVCHGNTRWGLEISKFFPAHQALETFDLERLSITYADSITSPSEYLLNWMLDNNIKNNSLNILQRNIFPFEEVEEAHTTKEVNSKIKKVVFFGRHEVRKGLYIFLDSINRILNEDSALQVYFIGKPQLMEGKQSIDVIMNALVKHKNRVSVLGSLSREDARKFIKAPDVLTVIPSISENLPFTVYECLKWNVKFIASNSGGTSEFFKAGTHDARLFEPNSNSLYLKLKEYLVKPIAEVGGSAINDIHSRLTFKQIHQDFRVGQMRDGLNTHSSSKVTVAVITHNRTNYLAQALSALSKQSAQDFEVIVVDDGSDMEDHLKYIRNLGNGGFPFEIRVLRTEDIGCGRARNYAAENSFTKYIIFLDDDNVPTSKFVENLVDAAERSDVDVVLSMALAFSGDDFPALEIDYNDLSYFPFGEAIYSGILKNNFGDSQGLWNRNSFLSLGGFETSRLPAEDWHIYAKASLRGKKILIAPFVGYFYRQHSNSLTVRVNSSREFRHRVVEIYSEVMGSLVAPFLGIVASETLIQAPSEQSVRSAIENFRVVYDHKVFLVSRILGRISNFRDRQRGLNLSFPRKIRISFRYYGLRRLSRYMFILAIKIAPALLQVRIIGNSFGLSLLSPVLRAPRIVGGKYFFNPNPQSYEVIVELRSPRSRIRYFKGTSHSKVLSVEPGLNTYPLLDLFKDEITVDVFAKVKLRLKGSGDSRFVWLL